MKNKLYYFFVMSFFLNACSEASITDQDKDQIERCKTQWENKQIAEAIECFLPLANNNNIAAQYSLGKIYTEQKQLSEQNKSVYWYEKAAKQGDLESQNNLGIIYFSGEIVPKDDIKAHY